MSGLLDASYTVPKSGDSSFLKLAGGDNKLRILGPPVMGYVYWQENIPVRIEEASQAPTGTKAKHFWQLPVYHDGAVKLLDISQSSILEQLTVLDKSSDWGNLTEYDITITKSGRDLDTTYHTTPNPKSPLPQDAITAYNTFQESYDPKKVFETVESADKDDLPF